MSRTWAARPGERSATQNVDYKAPTVCAWQHLDTARGQGCVSSPQGLAQHSPAVTPAPCGDVAPAPPNSRLPNCPPEGTSPSVTPCHWDPCLLGSPVHWARETGPLSRRPPGTPRVCSGALLPGGSVTMTRQVSAHPPSPQPNQDQEQLGGVGPARPSSKNSPNTPARTGQPHGTRPPRAAPWDFPVTSLSHASLQTLPLASRPHKSSPRAATEFPPSGLPSGQVSLSGVCPCIRSPHCPHQLDFPAQP